MQQVYGVKQTILDGFNVSAAGIVPWISWNGIRAFQKIQPLTEKIALSAVT